MSAVPKVEVKDETPEVTARRLKKRELDRKAQRMARERTKSRIAHLEELVGHLSHNDTNAEVSQLMERLLQTTQERDKLVGVLASLGTTIRHHTDALAAAQAEGSSSAVVAAMQALSDRGDRTADVKPFEQTHNHGPLTTSHGRREDYPHTDNHMHQHPPPPPAGFGWGFENPDLQQHQAQNSAAMPPYNSREFDELPPANPVQLPRSDSEFSSETSASADHYIIPPPHQLCECVTIIEPPNAQRGSGSSGGDPNTWREGNRALGKAAKLSLADIEAEDRASQDTPVRAVIEGWESVERAGMMTDSWRKLRVLDEICFSKSGPVERLAVLRMMHLLICSHGDPTPERLATLPRWYRKRPSQLAIPHSYAIDFFVWPGVRERFVFSQHRYCTNLFWKLFRSNLTLLWQFDFDDCFMQSTATGHFQLAPLFEERIRDIKSWTMNADFLNQYPELCDDIPMYMGIPAKPSTPRSALVQQHARWSTSTTPRPIKRDVDEPVDMVPQQQQVDDLAKSSALVVTTQAPPFADAEYLAQSPGVHVTMAGTPGYAYDQSGVMVPTTLAPADLGPGGQHVYSGGSWFYSYCQHGYT